MSHRARSFRNAGEQLLTIAIPTYNRAAVVGSTIAQIVSSLGGHGIDFLIVDDGSTDGTQGVLDEQAAQQSDVRVVRKPRNMGYGRALTSVFREAKGEWVLVTSDDDELVPEAVLDLMGELRGLRASFLSSQWIGADGLARGRAAARGIRGTDLRAAANHAPALVYRRSDVLPLLPFLEELCTDRDPFALVYPQVVLAADLIARRGGIWWPVALGKVGRSLPSGLRDSSGRTYWSAEARLAQALSLHRILEVMARQPGVHQRYRWRIWWMQIANESSVVWGLNLLAREVDPDFRGVYRTAARAFLGRLPGATRNRLRRLRGDEVKPQ